MLEASLERQEACLDAVRETGAAVMLDNVAHLLLSTNPCSGRPDYLTNIARYVTYNSWLPEHALCAVRIINWTCMTPAILPRIVPLFTVDEVGLILVYSLVLMRKLMYDCRAQAPAFFTVLLNA
jgi:nuclear pore complex protein Nup205